MGAWHSFTSPRLSIKISNYSTVEFAYNGTSGGFLKPAVIAEFTL